MHNKLYHCWILKKFLDKKPNLPYGQCYYKIDGVETAVTQVTSKFKKELLVDHKYLGQGTFAGRTYDPFETTDIFEYRTNFVYKK